MTDDEFRQTIQQIVNLYRTSSNLRRGRAATDISEETIISLFWDERRQKHVISEERIELIRQIFRKNSQESAKDRAQLIAGLLPIAEQVDLERADAERAEEQTPLPPDEDSTST